MMKTLAEVQSNYYFPPLREKVYRYVSSCSCIQEKDSSLPQPYLRPLGIPEYPFQSVSMDFITALPRDQGYDSVMTIVDRFTKIFTLIPCIETVSAVDCGHLFFENVFRRYGIPSSIVSDRDPKFTSKFWGDLWRLCSSDLLISTARHPQTDSQTEKLNHIIETSMRCFCIFL